ncbi:hypothetical protein FCH28_29380 [Streptomyces piniterrae]|uniref:DUF2029 domain-containing protein n=1 Tax=Streptomyces piniterrae TaxID=2571125 RepID=A0A4U0MTZ9_9ACTN|nr:hypothetical protein [Streptomyces piniterrae]TJZ44465.1 hypothetical protein FCH28_29380 [Streptomyces piniterrae]
MRERLELRPLPAAAFVQPHWRASGPLPWVTAIALAFAVVQLVVVVPGSGLSWDETIYVSQVGGHTPPAFFSAPRARGISYLVAPVVALTSSTTALRIYLAVLSAAALFVALWIWRKVLPTPVLAWSGALFAGLWPTVFYGPAAMPNLWCALGALAAVGCFVRAVHGAGDRAAVAGVGVAVALVAALRPADGVWLTLPLLLAVVLVPRWRRPAVFAVLVAGLLVGGAPWIVEAYAHHGGLLARLHRASEIQGGLGWHIAVDDQARALAGRTLCRPCGNPWRVPATAAWWAAVPVLVFGGIAVAHRRHRGGTVLLTAMTAMSLAVPYLFLIDYAAPRFLLPAYALLAVPVADCIVHLLTGVRRALRLVSAVVVTLAVVGHVGVQYQILSRVTANSRITTARYTEMAGALHRLGVRPPCVVSGDRAVPIAFYAGCASRQTGGHDASSTPEVFQAGIRRMPTAVIVAGRNRPPGFARDWRSVPLPHTHGGEPHRVYLPRRSHPSGAP